jgi:hypothetical protein
MMEQNRSPRWQPYGLYLNLELLHRKQTEAMKEAQAIAFSNKKRKSDDTITHENSEGENDDEDDSDTETTWNT